ncbi:PLP-dependent aminotransferase family protein [Streptomyces sp. NBC_00433]
MGVKRTSTATVRPAARVEGAEAAPAPRHAGGGGSGPAWEVLVDLGVGRGRGRVLQAGLREAVRVGRLGAGTQLPSSRELAADLGVSRGMVTDAYAQLTAEGYLTSRQGAGTWVADVRQGPVSPPAGAFAADDRGGPDDLRPGLPDLALFPRAAWSAAHRRVMTALPHRAFGYPDPRGLPELRAALAALLGRRRGVAAEPDQVVVTAGVAQAHTLLGHVLHARGQRTTAVEDPGSPEHTALLAATGLTAVAVPVDAEGLSVTALAATGVRSAVVTPCHQFPSGVAYSAARRAALADWARDCGGVVVEDDYDGDFRYDRQPVGALQGLAPGHVVYTGSASKSLAPGLRLGWLVGPRDIVAEAAERKRTMDLGHSVTEQAALADFLASGAYDRQLRRCQRLYRARRDALVGALARCAPGAEVSGIAAGLHAIVTLPERYGPEPAFLAAAARAGVAVRPLSHYRTSPRPPGEGDGRVRLVVGYAHLTPEAITRAVRLLVR